jgi:hypothetical protein
MLGQFFAAARSRRQAIDALVRQVAEASVAGVCTLVAERVAEMGPFEARGYIRGRAGREIRRQARLVLGRRPAVEQAWQSVVVARATDRLPALTLRQLAAETLRTGVPQRSHERRAA